jgi:hypothetical protein
MIAVEDRRALLDAFLAALDGVAARRGAEPAAVEEFSSQARARSEVGAVEYGERSWTSATAVELLDEAAQECVDGAVWLAMVFARLARLRPVAERLERHAAFAAAVQSAVELVLRRQAAWPDRQIPIEILAEPVERALRALRELHEEPAA